jgi:hypothetical protein
VSIYIPHHTSFPGARKVTVYALFVDGSALIGLRLKGPQRMAKKQATKAKERSSKTVLRLPDLDWRDQQF